MSNDKLADAVLGKFTVRRAFLFSAPFMLMGAVALVFGLYGLVTRQLDFPAAKRLLTVMVVCTGIPLVIFGWFANKRPKAVAQLKARHPEKPWMWREDWAAGRVDNSVRRSVFFLWLAVIGFNLVCLLAVFVVLHGVRYGSGGGWLALIFPVTGAAVLVFAAKTAQVWGRFGRSAFVMNALPGVPGQVIAGEIRVPARLQPEHAFYLRLSCLRLATVQKGKTRTTAERILWQDEKWFRPNLPQPVAGATCIPVFFTTPADLPPSSGTAEDGVQWRLEAQAKVSGPDFNALYEVPVFKPAAAPATAAAGMAGVPPVVPADPTLPFQLTLDEVRKEIRSRIQIVNIPDGREFIFPAGRNAGFATIALGLWLIWTGAIVLMLVWRAPFLFPLIFSAVDVIMGIFMFDLWLRRTTVAVTPGKLKINTNWLTLRKEIVLAPGEVASLKAELGATAGHTAYYDLRIRTRRGREVLAAKFLNHKPEADWLIRQMVAALKQAKPAGEGGETH